MRFSLNRAAPIALALATLLGTTAITHTPAAALKVACQPDVAQQQFCGKRVVEVMFVLDTTGSMAGLIAGAKQKIWAIANEVVDNDPNAIVRMGLIGYRDLGDAYVTKFFDLTTDVDGLYGKLLGFQAAGGGDTPESVNQAIYEGVTRASWTPKTTDSRNIRLVFLAGDAPPKMNYQQDVKYPESMRIARDRGIKVNTLQAGRMRETQRVWIEIARLGDGVYAQIPQSGNVQVIKTPFDQQIHKLQRRLDDTIIPYGSQRLRDGYRQKLKSRISTSSAATADRAAYRAKQSGKKEVVTGGGDLLAEIESGAVSLDTLDASKLPNQLRAASPQERTEIIAKRKAERAAIDGELNQLLSKRANYLKENTPKTAKNDSFDRVIRESISKAF